MLSIEDYQEVVAKEIGKSKFEFVQVPYKKMRKGALFMLVKPTLHVYKNIAVNGVSFFESADGGKCYLKGYGTIVNSEVENVLKNKIVTAFNDMFGKKYFKDNCEFKIRFAKMECCASHNACNHANRVFKETMQLEFSRANVQSEIRVCLCKNFVHSINDYESMKMEKFDTEYRLKPPEKPKPVDIDPSRNIFLLASNNLDGFVTIKIVGIYTTEEEQESSNCVRLWCHIIESHFKSPFSEYVEDMLACEKTTTNI